MKNKAGLISLMAIMAALLVSGTVFAEGEQPPAAPSECGECPAQVPAQSPPAPEEAPAAESTAYGTEVDVSPTDLPAPAVEETSASSAPVQEQQTDIVLVDDAGDPLDMASQASAQKITAADPRWKVGTQWYSVVADEGSCYPGTSVANNTCFEETGDLITSAISRIANSGLLPTDRKLYIEAGEYTEDVVIDNASSLLNGLIGVDGSALTTINGNISITDNINGFTLSGFTINGGISILNSTGALLLEDLNVSNPSGIGIVIGERFTPHPGTATLKDVRVNGNTSHGATIFTTGNISVTNSSFDDNGGDGLRVESSAGTMTLKGVSASRNGERGIYNLNTFTKTFTLQHVQANDNGLYGVDVGLSNINFGTASGAFIADTVYAQNNHASMTTIVDIKGFKVTTYGAITLKNILVENTYNGFGLVLIHDSATPIVLQNVVSRGNGKNGIDIGTNGNVSLTSVKSTNNGADGIKVTNHGPGDKGTITITSPASAGSAGANDFSNNGGMGLDLRSNNNITLTNLDASGNGSHGLMAITPGNLTISKNLPNWVNGFGSNGGHGIWVRAEGNINLGYCDASDNTLSGVYFNSTAKSAALTGGRFDNNGDHGLYILASGNVVLTDINSASNNDWDGSGSYFGIYIGNSANVTIRNTSKTATTAVGNNSGRGVNINSNGSVSITGLGAWSNGSDGIYILNRVWPGGKPVSLTRVESIFNNGSGVYVYTAGNVTMQDIFTAENNWHGMQIEACVHDGSGGCRNLANVTLKGGNNAFSNNGQAGLDILTKGSVSLSHIDVYGNDNGGVKIINSYIVSSPVTIGGKVASKIDSNSGYGLWVDSLGAINVKNTIVQNTTDLTYGVHGAVYLVNNGPAKKSITLTDIQVMNNEQRGLYINSDGPVALQGVSSSYNSITTGWIDPSDSTNGVRERLSGYWENTDLWRFNGVSGTPYTITLTSADFLPMLSLEDEWGYQLDIDENLDGDGIATLSFSPSYDGEFTLRVQAADWGMGVYELTFGGDIYDQLVFAPFSGASIYTPAAVNISSTKNTFSAFGYNNADGLYIYSGASVAMLNVSANDNYGRGIYVEAPNGNVTLGNNHASRLSYFYGNREQGVMVISGGAITLNHRLAAFNNGDGGFYLNNDTALTPKTITIRGVTANDNNGSGIRAYSDSTINLINVTASNNAVDGTDLQTLGNVAVSGNNVFSGNSGKGLYIYTSGTTSISGLLAENNGFKGLHVESLMAGKTVLIKNSLLRFNNDNGLEINAYGMITLDGVQSLLNTGSGVDTKNNGVQVVIKNSVMMGNIENGLRVQTGFYSLVNSLYFGNVGQNIYLY